MLKPGERLTLTDGNVVEVVIDPYVLLGVPSPGVCQQCCIGLHLGKKCTVLRGGVGCSEQIGHDNFFREVTDNGETIQSPDNREDEVTPKG